MLTSFQPVYYKFGDIGFTRQFHVTLADANLYVHRTLGVGRLAVLRSTAIPRNEHIHQYADIDSDRDRSLHSNRPPTQAANIVASVHRGDYIYLDVIATPRHALRRPHAHDVHTVAVQLFPVHRGLGER